MVFRVHVLGRFLRHLGDQRIPEEMPKSTVLEAYEHKNLENEVLEQNMKKQKKAWTNSHYIQKIHDFCY